MSFGYIPNSGIAGSRGRLFSNFWRNHHNDFQSSCTSLHSHQQWRNFPLTSYHLQQKLSSVFLILAILTGNLRVVLICISLMTKDVEHFLKCLSAILDSFVESSLFRSVLNFLLDYLFFWCQVSWVLCIFGDQSSVSCGVGEDLFPFCRLLFCLVNHVLCFTEASQFQGVSFINRLSQCLCY